MTFSKFSVTNVFQPFIHMLGIDNIKYLAAPELRYYRLMMAYLLKVFVLILLKCKHFHLLKNHAPKYAYIQAHAMEQVLGNDQAHALI